MHGAGFVVWALLLLTPLPVYSQAARERRTLQVGGVSIPITVLRGPRPGPVLTLTAGIHGDEYPPVLALQRVAARLNPDELSGTVVIVHLANPQGFFSRTIARNPVDGKNLNRSFPGRADGTITEQIADLLAREVVEPTDYLIDFHSGSANAKLLPHAYSPVVDNPALDARTLAFARAVGFEHIVLYGDRPRDPANSISYPNTGQTRGKPSLTLECGQMGVADEACIQKLADAAQRALQHLKMMAGTAPPTPARLYRKIFDAPSPATGIFHAAVQPGQSVKAQDLLGHISSLYGDRIAEVRSPGEGVVLYHLTTPPVTQGESVATLAQ